MTKKAFWTTSLKDVSDNERQTPTKKITILVQLHDLETIHDYLSSSRWQMEAL